MGIEDLLGDLVKPEQQADMWAKVILPESSNLIIGDVRTGKTGLAFYLLERFSKEYNLAPMVVGLTRDKAALLPAHFKILDTPQEVTKQEKAIIFIDEADLQLSMEDPKKRKMVINFLSLPGHRDQILILAFHFPRLILGRYVPYFATIMIKRPPYFLEYAGKSKNDMFVKMMARAEERFKEMPSQDDIRRSVYVASRDARWQGMLHNPLCSFWSTELSKAWSGVPVEAPCQAPLEPLKKPALTTDERLEKNFGSVSPEIKARIIEMDRSYPLEQLRRMCQDKGLPTSGDKKTLAGRLVFSEVVAQVEKREG